MRIWIVSEFYESVTDTVGGYYVKGVAEKLASTENVEVVFPSNGSQPQTGRNDRIKINHIYRFSFNRKNLIIRTAAQIIISLQFLFFLLPRTRKDDIVVSFTHPPFMILFCTLLKKLKKVKLAVVNYDLFPEMLIGTGVLKDNLFYRLLLKMYDRSYKNVDVIISLGQEMTEILKNKINNSPAEIHTLSNWADIDNIYFQPKETNEIIVRYGLESKIVFSYAGSIGRCQGIDSLLELIDNIDNRNDIHFLFFGKGVGIDSFTGQILKNRNRTLITYAGFIVTEDKKKFINACDVAIISLMNGMTGLNFPSKTYNIFASGHPVLFVGKEDSEMARMITAFNAGWVCPSSDPKKFREIINEIAGNREQIMVKGKNAREIAEKHYAKEDILEKYMDLFRKLILKNRV